MAMKPKKMRGGGMVKKMRGGGMVKKMKSGGAVRTSSKKRGGKSCAVRNA